VFGHGGCYVWATIVTPIKLAARVTTQMAGTTRDGETAFMVALQERPLVHWPATPPHLFWWRYETADRDYDHPLTD
jgi:hypothetical protein